MNKLQTSHFFFLQPILASILLLSTMPFFAESAVISDGEPFSSSNITPSATIYDDDPDFFKVQSEKPLTQNKETSLVIETNVTGASVYINNNYRGTTPLTIKNLTEGKYKVRIEKAHYDTKTIYVKVRKGQQRCYYVELERITGKLLFSVTPGNATISCDGSTVNSNPITVDEGSHTITVRCFGYNTWSSSVSVYRNMLRRVSVQLDEAAFAITAIKASRASFNPRNAGSLGTTTINFSVTAPAAGTLTICDQYGSVVWTASYVRFTTWDYAASWDGRTQSGAYAVDGIYTATLSSEGQTASCSFSVDSSITYPMLSITPDGTGLGSVASAEMYPGDTMMFYFGLGPSFDILNRKLYGAPFTAQFGWAFANWGEFSLGYNVMLGSLKTPSFYLNTKFGGHINISYNAAFCYAFNARFGFTKDALYEPYGADIGTGLGTGVMLGIDTDNFYFGLASEFIYGPVKGILTKGNDLSLKNGALIQFKLNGAACGMYCSLNSCFGTYNYTTTDDSVQHTGTITGAYRALDGGIQGSVYFNGSSVSAVGRTGVIWYPGETVAGENELYIYSLLGISIVF